MVAWTLVSLAIVSLSLTWVASHRFGFLAVLPLSGGTGRISLNDGTVDAEYVWGGSSELIFEMGD